MLAVRPDKRWQHSEVGLIVPRQNGKGSVLEIRALAGLFLLREEMIMWSAHEYKTAMEGFRRIRALIDNTDDLRKQVKSISGTHGIEGIELRSGQRLRFLARSKGSGRGFSGVTNIIDEAYAYTEDQKSALMPTMSAQVNPQIIYTSSPPLDGLTGEPLFSLRERGEAGTDPGLCWIDFGLDIDPENPDHHARIGDVREWERANPAYEIRISREAIDREYRGMTREAFCRERLGVWPKRASDSGVISLAQWRMLGDEYGEMHDPVVFGADVAPDRQRASISAFSVGSDGVGRLEVVDNRPGTEWLIDRLVQLRNRWNPLAVAVDLRGPAVSLFLELEEAGLKRPADPEWPERGDLAVPTVQEVAASCGQMVDAIAQGTVRHRNQPVLNAAVAGVKTRPLGDAYAFGRRASSVDISALCAVSLARWAYLTRAHLAGEDPLGSIW